MKSCYNLFEELIDKHSKFYKSDMTRTLDLKNKSKLEWFYEFYNNFTISEVPKTSYIKMKVFYSENKDLVEQTQIKLKEYILKIIADIKTDKIKLNELYKEDVLKFYSENNKLPIYLISYLHINKNNNEKNEVIIKFNDLIKKLKSNSENEGLINEIIQIISENTIIINEYLENKDSILRFEFEFKPKYPEGTLINFCDYTEKIKSAKINFSKKLIKKGL